MVIRELKEKKGEPENWMKAGGSLRGKVWGGTNEQSRSCKLSSLDFWPDKHWIHH